MTNFSQDIHPYRGNKSDANGNFQEEELILADLHATSDDSGLQIASLRHWQDDEEAMGRLVINNGVEVEGETAFTHEGSWGASEPKALPQAEENAAPATNKTHQAARYGSAITVAKVALKTASPAPGPAVVKPEIPLPFVVESFIASHRAMRPDLNAGQYGFVNDEIAETAIEPAQETGQETAQAELMAAAPDAIAEAVVSDKGITEDRNKNRRQGKLTNTIQPSNWVATLITATLLSLLAATVSLVLTVSTLKTEVNRLSALMAIVKDDVEALGQK